MHDTFFSYARQDFMTAQPLLDALRDAGVRVWLDKVDLPDNTPVTQEIRQALATSNVLIAFYSRHYPGRRACQQELITAWTAAQRAGE